VLADFPSFEIEPSMDIRFPDIMAFPGLLLPVPTVSPELPRSGVCSSRLSRILLFFQVLKNDTQFWRRFAGKFCGLLRKHTAAWFVLPCPESRRHNHGVRVCMR